MSRFRSLIAFASLVGAATSASAQNLVDPGLNLLRERQRQESLRNLSNAPQGSRIEAQTEARDKSVVCFPISRIEVENVKSLPDGSLDGLTNPFEGRCLGQSEIEQLVQALRKNYLERGFITTQVVVPAQDLKSGVLRLSVVEGRVARIVYGILRDGEKPKLAPWGKLITAFPGVTGETLQLRDLEQGVAQINRNSSSAASIDILPGDEPGTSIIKVTERQQRAVRVSAGFDTSGQTATDRLRLRTNIDFDNLLSLNDAWSGSYAGSRSSNAIAATTSIPYGYWTFSNSASYSQQNASVSQVADMVTESATETLIIDRVIFRDANLVLRASQSLNWYWNRRFINSTALKQQFIGWSRSGVSLERYFEKSRFSIDFGLGFGLPEIARTDDAPEASGAAKARFAKIDFAATYLRNLGSGWSLLASATGQYSPDTLYAANQIAAGGADSVRGFRGYGLSGDRGVYLRSELQWGSQLPWARPAEDPQNGKPPLAIWTDLSAKGLARQVVTNATPYFFADGGVIRSNATQTSQRLGSLGAGVRTGGERISFDATLAVPVVRPNGRTRSVEASLSMNIKLW